MKKIFAVFFFCIVTHFFCQQKVSGRTMSDNDMVLAAVLVVNMTTDKKVYSNSSGEFSIEASENDEIRFVKKGYERVSKKVYSTEVPINAVLERIPEEIEEVEIVSANGSKIDKKDQLQKAIGLPKPKTGEKPREVPAELKNVLLAAALGSLDVQGTYDLISGKARRQKRQYKYEDLQSDILWIRKRIADEDFVKEGIPPERISEFLEFSFIVKPNVRKYARAKNISGVMFNLEEVIPVYVERLKENNKSKEVK